MQCMCSSCCALVLPSPLRHGNASILQQTAATTDHNGAREASMTACDGIHCMRMDEKCGSQEKRSCLIEQYTRSKSRSCPKRQREKTVQMSSKNAHYLDFAVQTRGDHVRASLIESQSEDRCFVSEHLSKRRCHVGTPESDHSVVVS